MRASMPAPWSSCPPPKRCLWLQLFSAVASQLYNFLMLLLRERACQQQVPTTKRVPRLNVVDLRGAAGS